MNVTFRQHPTVFRKLRQLYRVTRASYCAPLTGEPQSPLLVEHEDLGITFIGHSSFLIQIGGRNLLVDPVFARALILLRRQRRPGIRVRDLPPIDAVLLTTRTWTTCTCVRCGRWYGTRGASLGSRRR